MRLPKLSVAFGIHQWVTTLDIYDNPSMSFHWPKKYTLPDHCRRDLKETSQSRWLGLNRKKLHTIADLCFSSICLSFPLLPKKWHTVNVVTFKITLQLLWGCFPWEPKHLVVGRNICLIRVVDDCQNIYCLGKKKIKKNQKNLTKNLSNFGAKI